MKQSLLFIICLFTFNFSYSVNPSETETNTQKKEPVDHSQFEEVFLNVTMDAENRVNNYLTSNKIECDLSTDDITILEQITMHIEDATEETLINFFNSDHYTHAIANIKSGATFGSIFYTTENERKINDLGHGGVKWDEYKKNKDRLTKKGRTLVNCFLPIRTEQVEELKNTPTETKQELDNTIYTFGSIVKLLYRNLLSKAKDNTNYQHLPETKAS